MVSVSSIANVNLKMLPILKSCLPLCSTDSNEMITHVPLLSVHCIICSVWPFWYDEQSFLNVFVVDVSIKRFIIWYNIISMRLCVAQTPVVSRGWDGLENQSLKEKLTKNWQIKRYGKLTNFCQILSVTERMRTSFFRKLAPLFSVFSPALSELNLFQILTSVVVSKELKQKRFWATLFNRKQRTFFILG